MLQTSGTMARRLGTLVLVAAVALSGLLSCPRGVTACSVARHTSHDCCKSATTVRTNECRCGGHHEGAAAIGSAPQHGHSPAKLLVSATVPGAIAPPECSVARAWYSLRHGLAPPDTPITQHTRLVL